MANERHKSRSSSESKHDVDSQRLPSQREISFASALSELLKSSEALNRAERTNSAHGDNGNRLLASVIRAAKKMTDEYEKYSASRIQPSFGDLESASGPDPYVGLAAQAAKRAKAKLKPMGEAEFQELARSKGWRTEKRGWPSYLCTKDTGEVLAVVVSPLLSDGQTKRLNRSRSEVMCAFDGLGLQCFVFNGEILEPFETKLHSPTKDAFGKMSQKPKIQLATARSNFKQSAISKGWSIFGTGWPDFACFSPDSEIIATEIKRRFADGTYEQLQPHQAQVMDALSRSGIPCYLSNGRHLEKFDPEKHGWRMLENLQQGVLPSN